MTIGSRKMTPPRMLRIVPFGERYISLRPNSSTRASSGVIVAHFTPTPCSLDRVGGVDGDLVLGGVAALDAEVVVLELDVEVGQDQLVLDELPDDPGHLVAVELDDGVLHLDLGHWLSPVIGSRRLEQRLSRARRRSACHHVPDGHAARSSSRAIFGIRIGASPSWFLVLFIMIFWLSGYFRDVLDGHSDTTAYLVAVAGTLLFFVSLILHELGHALVARRNGIEIAGIDLWLFGGLAKMTRDTVLAGRGVPRRRRRPGRDAGHRRPLRYGARAARRARRRLRRRRDADRRPQTHRRRSRCVGWLAVINVFLFVFNLVPAFPLDGGRIARAVAWKLTGDRNRGHALLGAPRPGLRLRADRLRRLPGLLRRRRSAACGSPCSAGSWARRRAAPWPPAAFTERLEGVTVGRRDGHPAGADAGRDQRRATPRTSSSCATAGRGSRSSTATGRFLGVAAPRSGATTRCRGRPPGADRRRAARAPTRTRPRSRGTRRSRRCWPPSRCAASGA